MSADMQQVVLSVIAWNSARYNQEHNKDLTIKLWNEEYFEWLLESPDDVSKLDALCDLTYLSIGVLWKLNTTEALNLTCQDQSARFVDYIMEANVIEPIFIIRSVMDKYIYDDHYPGESAAHHIIMLCTAQAISMGLTYIQFVEAMLAVCKSNNTKPAKKTSSDVKASTDKGSLFIPPTADLQRILDARQW